MGVTWGSVWDPVGGTRPSEKKWNTEVVEMQIKIEMKLMWQNIVGKEPEGGNKKRKSIGNESPLDSIFQKEQSDNDLEKTERRIMEYFRRRNSWGWKRQRIPNLCTGQVRKRLTSHCRVTRVGYGRYNSGWNSVMPKQSVNPNCVPKSFHPELVCEKSLYDVLVSQQFQDSITTVQSTTQVVISQKKPKRKQDQGKGCQVEGESTLVENKWKVNDS